MYVQYSTHTSAQNSRARGRCEYVGIESDGCFFLSRIFTTLLMHPTVSPNYQALRDQSPSPNNRFNQANNDCARKFNLKAIRKSMPR